MPLCVAAAKAPKHTHTDTVASERWSICWSTFTLCVTPPDDFHAANKLRRWLVVDSNWEYWCTLPIAKYTYSERQLTLSLCLRLSLCVSGFLYLVGLCRTYLIGNRLKTHWCVCLHTMLRPIERSLFTGELYSDFWFNCDWLSHGFRCVVICVHGKTVRPSFDDWSINFVVALASNTPLHASFIDWDASWSAAI